MATSTRSMKIAAAQIAPVFLDKKATTDKVCRFIRDAGDQGVQVVGFPECCIPGYPAWGQIIPAESQEAQGFFLKLFHNSVEVPGPEVDQISQTCKEANVFAVVGINERRRGTTGTMFNTQLFFGSDGQLLHKHQKFVPTMTERLVHAPGQTGSVVSVNTPFGGLSGLICGENVNPLAMYSVSLGYPVIHVASWPTHFGEHSNLTDGILVCTRGLSFTLGCFIINSVAIDDDVAIDAYSKSSHDPEHTRKWLIEAQEKSRATIVGPMGSIVAGPLTPGEGLLTAEISIDDTIRSKFGFDVAGHYNRPEVFAHLFSDYFSSH